MTMKILIVDDKIENLYLLESLLKGNGYHTISAKNGAEALGFANKEKPDLIIADILMPVMDGYTLCHECKKDNDLKNIPFIFYTATYTDPKDEEFALSLGADKFILKPQEPEMFLGIIEECLKELKKKNKTQVIPPELPETIVLKEYNQTLIRKLEDKMRQTDENEKKLKRYVQELEESLEEIKKAEAEIKKLNEELEHRVEERTAQLKEAIKELEAFSYSVSHDLRAPLRAINGFAKILLEDHSECLTKDCKDLINTIATNANNMSKLIEDLLSFSRLSRQGIHKSVISMKELTKSVINEFVDEKNKDKIEISVAEIPNSYGDYALIQQVLRNLIGNAIKFSSKRDKSIIKIDYTPNESEMIYFITDNGVGFNIKYSDKLFGVFQRLHNSIDFDGTGVGLAIVQSIINRHGGRVWAEAGINKGATFYFTLPIEK